MSRDYSDLINKPFKKGGRTPEGFDCAGVPIYVLEQEGHVIGPCASVFGDAELQGQAILRVLTEKAEKINQPEPFCIVTFWTRDPAWSDHLGIVLKGKQFLHASRVLKRTLIEDLDSPFWKYRITGYYRIKR